MCHGVAHPHGGHRSEASRCRSHDAGPETRAPGGERGDPLLRLRVEVGYHTAMDVRVAGGSLHKPGPAAVWLHMRHSLVAGEEPSPLARVLVAADSGNGVSWTLSLSRFLFVNVDLSVHLHRPAVGEWVCLDATTTAEGSGVGLADTRLWGPERPARSITADAARRSSAGLT